MTDLTEPASPITPFVSTATAVSKPDPAAALSAAIDKYLDHLPSSTWGRSFSIDKPEGRERAGAYILNVFCGVAKELESPS